MVVGIVIITGVSVLYKNNKLKQQKNLQMQQQVEKTETLREALVLESLKRSLVQQKIISSNKKLFESLKLTIQKSDQIEFKKQIDFNAYEAMQNEIQQAITKLPLKTKNKKSNLETQKIISELEWADKKFNDARLKFSEAEISKSKLESKNPVTFISDIQLLQTNKN